MRLRSSSISALSKVRLFPTTVIAVSTAATGNSAVVFARRTSRIRRRRVSSPEPQMPRLMRERVIHRWRVSRSAALAVESR
ncbi:hypothetical protein ACFFX0_22690 [Citricoccus parietis]|uniref:Secreted protein n=1 Tax=Citricoccus parietis TaxID=592307 RepID=A0ABV5G4K5_9MICC